MTGPTHDARGMWDIIDVLEAAGIRYWVDSGVLLGLRRDGRLLSWEKDIDLAVEGGQADALVACVPELGGLGYTADINRYRGIVWSVGLKPTEVRPSADLRAAVHVYYRIGASLWSPQPQMYVPPPAPDVLHGRRTPPGRVLRWAMERWFYTPDTPPEEGRISRAPDRITIPYRMARWAYRRLDRGMLAELWPLREVYCALTWVVPAALVLPLGTLTEGGRVVPVPGDVDAYLTYRYGDWQQPVTNWCYWEDDGAISHENPVEVAKALRREASAAAVAG